MNDYSKKIILIFSIIFAIILLVAYRVLATHIVIRSKKENDNPNKSVVIFNSVVEKSDRNI